MKLQNLFGQLLCRLGMHATATTTHQGMHPVKTCQRPDCGHQHIEYWGGIRLILHSARQESRR